MITSICSSLSTQYPTKSSRTTNSAIWSTMAESTSRYAAACMVFLRPASSPDPFPRHAWLRTCPPHARPLATPLAPHQVLPRRRRLWRQIHRQRTCRPSHPMPPQPLPRSRHRLGLQTVLWCPLGMGL